MPYKIVGTDVYHMKDGKWVLMAHHATKEKAKAQLRLLYGVESGMTPRK